MSTRTVDFVYGYSTFVNS